MSKQMKITLMIIAVLLLAGLAGIGVSIALKTNTQQAVAPNSPEGAQAATDKKAILQAIRDRAAARSGGTTGGGVCPVLSFVVGATVTATPSANVSAEWKKVYNEAGDTVITSVERNQTFTYKVSVKNTGTVAATGVKVTDVFNGENQNWLTYISSDGSCSYDSTSKTVSCTVDVPASSSKVVSIKVKVSNDATNGATIANKAKVSFGTSNTEAAASVTVSTVVACNNSCTQDSQCETGLACISGKCRRSTCSDETDCTCAEATGTTTPTATPTGTSNPTATNNPTGTNMPAGTNGPASLPNTGIVSVPGAVAFGSGLLLTIIGILFAL